MPPALPRRSAPVSVSDPHMAGPTTPAGLSLPPVWPLPLSLAATRGVSVDFPSSGYLDVSVPRVASPRPMCSGGGWRDHVAPGCPIRRPAGRRVRAPHRGLSQLAASFIGFQCQGIHRAPIPSCLDGWCRRPRGGGEDAIKDLVSDRAGRARAASRSLSCYAALRVRGARAPGTGCRDRLGLTRRTEGRGGRAARLSCVPSGRQNLPRKEVIQPHVPVRLPCYDFTPLTLHTFGASPLTVGPATSGADDSGGVTGGVYKARERIHRGVLIRDY